MLEKSDKLKLKKNYSDPSMSSKRKRKRPGSTDIVAYQTTANQRMEDSIHSVGWASTNYSYPPNLSTLADLQPTEHVAAEIMWHQQQQQRQQHRQQQRQQQSFHGSWSDIFPLPQNESFHRPARLFEYINHSIRSSEQQLATTFEDYSNQLDHSAHQMSGAIEDDSNTSNTSPSDAVIFNRLAMFTEHGTSYSSADNPFEPRPIRDG
jgi:hypothetical protein